MIVLAMLAIGIALYNQQLTNGAFRDVIVTLGPYRFRFEPIEPITYLRNLLVARLPGPAAGGWYVLIGPNPRVSPDSTANNACLATIVTSSAVDGPQWDGVDQQFVPQHRFGPYSSIEEAAHQLEAAGWRGFVNSTLWFAQRGC